MHDDLSDFEASSFTHDGADEEHGIGRLADGFSWGVATSAYQIEGSPFSDGAGESIWDRFVRTKGTVAGGDTGDIACDHYRRMEEDVALMARLGVDTYSFSIAWTRVIPDGHGVVNSAGLGFYDRLVDTLLANGIEPCPTLYHWDLPQALQDRGGWPERATVDAFVHYTDVVSSALGDRARHWITHNEPWVASMLGYLEGAHAPGLRDWRAALPAAHHLLLSHGRSVPIIRANVPGASVGITIDCRPTVPASSDPADLAAQRHFDGFRNRWFFDPVFGRGYPEDIVATYRDRGRFEGARPPFDQQGDMAEIAAPIDFLGVNYYTSLTVAAGADEIEDTGVAPGPNPPGGHTEMGWPITPAALSQFLKRVHDDYGPDRIIVTENGASFSDAPGPDGRVRDERRIRYLSEHIEAVADAAAQGVPVVGYYVWSFMDNFEWSLGYSQRFGLVFVDFATGERTPKDSFHWYARLIRG